MLAVSMTLIPQAHAGPPYISDDPEPTDHGHYEAYLFAGATSTRDGTGGAAGIDFSYGVGPDLQLTLVAPTAYEQPSQGASASGMGNIELAAKWRVAHQAGLGWDLSFFPRVFLPSASRTIGDQHGSYLLPVWVEKDWGKWSTFGGGGFAINRGNDARDYSLVGWAIARQVTPRVQIGAELFHQTADTEGGLPTTGLNAGLRYDLSDHYLLLGSIGSGIQNASATNERSWYLALLITR
jgi:opacity protein-like surface antigen